MLKRFLPRTLFGRALIIIVTPVVLVQVIAAVVFFERHLQTVTKRMARSVAGDIAYVVAGLKEFPEPASHERLLALANRTLNINVILRVGEGLPSGLDPKALNAMEQSLHRSIEAMVGKPFTLQWRPDLDAYLIYVQLDGVLLQVIAPTNRFTSATAHIFMAWTVGASALLLAIAILFLRNQVRPIRRLAEAAERFGKGHDVNDFRPSGAAEVRQAAAAFIRMRDRIRRQIRQRTEMLAGVSHDLRTPLTRMKLALELMPQDSESVELKADVDEMRRMVDGYLDFARGAEGEAATPVDVGELLAEIAADARRQGAQVALATEGDLVAELRPQALRRCLKNLVENAVRYAQQLTLIHIS
jgi:two-component system osmolarity sensor histidine kinase EnvZ